MIVLPWWLGYPLLGLIMLADLWWFRFIGKRPWEK